MKQINLEEKGLRMREVKQRRNWAGMSTRNINKPATELANLLKMPPESHPIRNDLIMLIENS